MEWNEEKSKEVLQKHRRRFGIRLTARIVGVIAALLLIYSIYLQLVNYIYEQSNTRSDLAYYTALAIDWTNPEYSVGIQAAGTEEISPFLTQKHTRQLHKLVGRREYLSGDVTVTKPFSTKNTEVKVNGAFNRNISDNNFYFTLPYWPKYQDEFFKGNKNEEVWRNLEMMDKGNVGTLAFSIDDLYSAEEMVEKLDAYDLDIIWMPLYTGESDYSDPSEGYSVFFDNLVYSAQWGLSPARYSERNSGAVAFGGPITKYNVRFTQDVMLANMERMLRDNKDLAQAILGTVALKPKYDYLKENGFQVFGAVVTGPVKELLKLETLPGLTSPHLGEIHPWNWYQEEYEEEYDGEVLEFNPEDYGDKTLYDGVQSENVEEIER